MAIGGPSSLLKASQTVLWQPINSAHSRPRLCAAMNSGRRAHARAEHRHRYFPPFHQIPGAPAANYTEIFALFMVPCSQSKPAQHVTLKNMAPRRSRSSCSHSPFARSESTCVNQRSKCSTLSTAQLLPPAATIGQNALNSVTSPMLPTRIFLIQFNSTMDKNPSFDRAMWDPRKPGHIPHSHPSAPSVDGRLQFHP
jgi:hypothetical protein